MPTCLRRSVGRRQSVTAISADSEGPGPGSTTLHRTRRPGGKFNETRTHTYFDRVVLAGGLTERAR